MRTARRTATRLRRGERCPPQEARIFAACHGTQLLVIQHLRRHLRRPPAREFLLGHPFENNPAVDRFMRAVVLEAGFDGTLDMRDFELLQAENPGRIDVVARIDAAVAYDAAALRAWLSANDIDEATAELWTTTIHFHAIFPRAVLNRARTGQDAALLQS